MIIEKLSKIELLSEHNINNEYRKIAAIRFVKELLNQVDFTSELIPMENYEKLTELLVSLKGKELSKCETRIVVEVVDN